MEDKKIWEGEFKFTKDVLKLDLAKFYNDYQKTFKHSALFQIELDKIFNWFIKVILKDFISKDKVNEIIEESYEEGYRMGASVDDWPVGQQVVFSKEMEQDLENLKLKLNS